MPVGLGAIADDFTGATDLANTWVKAGVRVAQIIGVPDGSSAHPTREARLMTLMAAQSIQAAGRITQVRAVGRCRVPGGHRDPCGAVLSLSGDRRVER